MVHIVSAHSIDSVRTYFGSLSETYVIEQLSWSEINRLAGIAPPSTDSDTELAEGPLMYEHQGRVISIEVAD